MDKLIKIGLILPIIDYFYLSQIKDHYNTVVKRISGKDMKVNMYKAVGAYIFLVYGIYYFIIKDLNQNNKQQKLIDSAILGWVIYGTFDFTNGAIFEDYDWKTMIMDTVWGGVLYYLSTYLYIIFIQL